MKVMAPKIRKFALAVHLIVSLGWIGGVLAYVALAVAAAQGAAETVRAAWTGMELIGWWVLIPLSVTTLVTGVVMAIGTPWGLFRHYWVSISLILTSIATGILVLHMPDVSTRADQVQGANPTQLEALGSDLTHSIGGLVLLLVVAVLNVYKPKGLTRHGWRKQTEQRSRPTPSEAR